MVRSFCYVVYVHVVVYCFDQELAGFEGIGQM
jgi:hypothetical protein